jgi:hypothetical protein
MTYTLNDRPILRKAQCGGTTRNGKPCLRTGYVILSSGFWCPWHGSIRGPNAEQRAILDATAAHVCEYANPNDTCEGPVTFGPDPYNEEINGDSTPYWMCEHHYSLQCEEI